MIINIDRNLTSESSYDKHAELGLLSKHMVALEQVTNLSGISISGIARIGSIGK